MEALIHHFRTLVPRIVSWKEENGEIFASTKDRLVLRIKTINSWMAVVEVLGRKTKPNEVFQPIFRIASKHISPEMATIQAWGIFLNKKLDLIERLAA